MSRYRRLYPYIARQWRWFVSIAVVTGAVSFATALQPWPMKLLVDYGLRGVRPPVWLAQWLQFVGFQPNATVLVLSAAVATLALFTLNSLLSLALGLLWNTAGQRMVYDLSEALFARFQRLSLLFHNRRSVGDSIGRLTEDTSCLYTLADGFLMGPLQQIITLVVMIGIGVALDPLLAALALSIAPLLAFSSRFFGKRLKQRSKLGREAKSRLMSFVHQTLGAIPLVQAFGTERQNTNRFQEIADDAVELAQRGNLLGSSYGLINGLITTTGMAVVLYVGGSRVISGAIPLGTLLVFLAYARQMQNSSGSLFKVFTKLKVVQVSVDRIVEVLESDEFVEDPPHPQPLQNGSRGHIRLEGITFGYEPDQAVLKNVTLEACAGEVVALVGMTGAGKTTLVSLIPRFFDPWDGRVMLDGRDIRQLKVADLRSQISLVLQEPFLMPISIADNIAYGRPHATRQSIESAAVAAQADEFIRRLPHGYDTLLNERGANLSGGERQRLSIARALLKDAPILVLDEPTSALDAQTEDLLVAALRRLMIGRTTFVIAHRLSTIRHADRIAVLDQGCLVQLGHHKELVCQEGLYRRLYEHQFADARGTLVV